jgi:Na+/proline symporter
MQLRALDLFVLVAFLVYIVWDGIRRGRESKDAEGYLLAGRRMRWLSMGLSVMATQASAITILSTTGQGFSDGMRFLHFYLAIPFAMVLLCATVVPWFHNARVFTAYEYLERRFDRGTRLLASSIFLVTRALAVGGVLYAPSIVLRSIGIEKWVSILSMGVLATIYTAIGGNTAVIITDAKQMVVMLAGIFACLIVAWMRLPDDVGLRGALDLAGATLRLDTFRVPGDWRAVLADKYNVFSGLLGGLFLFLGYFGADQEQVQRYLAGSSVDQSRKSLLLSAFAKVPMQFVILLVGVLIWAHYCFAPAPPFFRAGELEKAIASAPASPDTARLATAFEDLRHRGEAAARDREAAARQLLASRTDLALASLRAADERVAQLRKEGMALFVDAGVDPNLAKGSVASDSDYVFTRFLVTEIPVGIAGLVLAAIFAAAISSLVSPLNSLATSTVVDLGRLTSRPSTDPGAVVRATRIATLFWGVFATVAAFWMGAVPIVEQVNRIGSFAYGSMFGVFILGRLVPRARGIVGAISLASGIAGVLALHWFVNDKIRIGADARPIRIEFMWYNLIGFVLVMVVGFVVSRFAPPVDSTPAPTAPPASE